MNRNRTRGTKRKEWMWFFGFLIGFIALLLGLYVRMVSVRISAFEKEPEVRMSPVRIQDSAKTEVWRSTSFLARLEGGQTIDIKADVGGWVLERRSRLGQEVKKDQPIIVLQDERKIFRLKEAESRLKSARANLNESKRKYDQTATLVEKGIAARDTLDSLSNRVAAEASNVDALDAAYNLIKWDVEHLTIRSPIDGKIVEIVPDIGQEVRIGELAARLVSASDEKVVAGVDAKWARIIKPGMVVNLSTESSGTLEQIKAEVIGVSPGMDSASGTYRVEARILNNEYDWWPGQIVNMEIPVELLTDIIIVPRSAVLSDNRNLFVFVYQEGKALKVPVLVTWINDKEGSIPADSIPQGAKVIIEGHVGLAGGQLVRVMQ